MTESSRANRYRGRAALRKVTTVQRCWHCGWTPTGSAVAIRHADGVAGYAGVQTCGRVWLCPVCNSKIMARRALEVGAALTWAAVEGHTVLWGSLTCRHDADTPLGWLLDVQRSAWRHVVSSRLWRAGGHRLGYVRAAEITIGNNGWHPHFHPLIITRLQDAAARGHAAAILDRWVEGVHRAGGEAILDGGQQLKPVTGVELFDTLTGYVTKATYDYQKLALETVWSQGKYGRGRLRETVSHWSLLRAIEQGLADEAERWADLEEATHGHRMITWSRGLRALAGLGDEADDETVAAEEVGTVDDTVCFLTPDGWDQVRRSPGLMANILDVQEAYGWGVLSGLLDVHGIEYFTLEAQPAEFVK